MTFSVMQQNGILLCASSLRPLEARKELGRQVINNLNDRRAADKRN